MEKKSFSAETKDALSKLEIKKKCCKYTFQNTISALDKDLNVALSARAVLDSTRCDNCLREFLRAAFLTVGAVTDPEKRYHLDFSFARESDSVAVATALARAGFSPGTTVRKGKFIVYFKDSDSIGDVLAYIGATSAAFDVMNNKIVRDVRKNANRLVNCDTANIEKALSASHKYVEAIEYIKSRGGLTALPAELREAAELRVQLSQASLSELAGKCQPPITKSGMKHRLEKLLSHAEELKNRTTD